MGIMHSLQRGWSLHLAGIDSDSNRSFLVGHQNSDAKLLSPDSHGVISGFLGFSHHSLGVETPIPHRLEGNQVHSYFHFRRHGSGRSSGGVGKCMCAMPGGSAGSQGFQQGTHCLSNVMHFSAILGKYQSEWVQGGLGLESAGGRDSVPCPAPPSGCDCRPVVGIPLGVVARPVAGCRKMSAGGASNGLILSGGAVHTRIPVHPEDFPSTSKNSAEPLPSKSDPGRAQSP